MPTRSRSIQATPEELFAVLTDYEKYIDWSPDVVGAAVLARESDIVVVEFVSPFLIEGKYILEFVHSRPSSITFRQVDQHDSRGLQGAWTLSPATDTAGTLLSGQMEFRTDLWKRHSDRRRADRVLQRRIDALQAHAAALFRRGHADTDPSEPAAIDSIPVGQAVTIWASDVEYRFMRPGQ